jgi:hypothetical protein
MGRHRRVGRRKELRRGIADIKAMFNPFRSPWVPTCPAKNNVGIPDRVVMVISNFNPMSLTTKERV